MRWPSTSRRFRAVMHRSPPHPHISKHKTCPARTKDAIAEIIRRLPRVGANAHLIERPHAAAAILRAEQGRRLVADHATQARHRARIHRHRKVAIESTGELHTPWLSSAELHALFKPGDKI